MVRPIEVDESDLARCQGAVVSVVLDVDALGHQFVDSTILFKH
ncbi:hypothetical protein IMCC9480_1129 [Oxalobacteraceae bacterium IMCC9480]|nr:hypothetical protein IMCC9480_1129 [Oxalobacteraceae bacterium IMCC9480]